MTPDWRWWAGLLAPAYVWWVLWTLVMTQRHLARLVPEGSVALVRDWLVDAPRPKVSAGEGTLER